MAHVVTERCVDCRYTDCCTVCPVDCFYEVQNPAMLVIDPNTCIDCALCIPACPISAIWPMDELPEPYQPWIEKNEELFAKGTNIKKQKDPLPGALNLAALQAREQSRGWSIREPSGAKDGDEHTAPAAAPVSSEAVLKAAASARFKWRSAKGIAKELGASPAAVGAELDNLVTQGQLRKFDSTNPKAPPLFAAASKAR